MQDYETTRLILRTSSPEMAEDVLEFYKRNAAELRETEPFDTPDFFSLSVQERNLSLESRLQADKRMIRFWIYKKEDPLHTIGTLSFMNMRGGSFCSASLGYKLDKNARHMGYAYEAISFGLDFVHDYYSMHRIEATVKPTNTPSIALLERLGFKQEGLIRQNVKLNGVWTNHLLYGLILDE